jgi:hypothetical protein
MKFIHVWITAIVTIIVLNLTWAVFSPVMNNIMNSMVLQTLYNSSITSMATHGAGYNAAYYNSLNTARIMIVSFFNLFAYILSGVVLIWAILSSLRREESDYYV